MNNDQMPPARRGNSRTRTGCLSCRKQHIRCDEARPTCGSCRRSRTARACEYRPAIPLRERRALADARRPWEQISFVAGTTPESQPSMSSPMHSMSGAFACLGIEMPLKSNELFHYFCQQCQSMSRLSQAHHTRYASSLTSDPATIRSTLLIAAIHLKWRTGGMQSFEPTFLHHQVDAIQTVNNWISKRRPKSLSSIIRQTATLCFIEFCLGRIASAQAHLKGMVSLLNCQIQDLHKPDQGVLPSKRRDDEELNDRYFLLLLTLSNRYKSRLSDSTRSDDSQSANPQEQVSHSDALYAVEMKCDAAMKLELLCMMPFFCQPLLSGAHWCWIDGAETIRDLRELTHSLDQIQSKVNVSRAETEFAMACANGVASHLHMRYIESHISSVFNPKAVGSRRSSDRKRRAAGLDTTWCGLYAATSLYLHDMLGIGIPEDPDCHRHTMYILKRSLCNHLDVLVNGTSATGHLLFWQIFLGAVSVQRISRQDMPWLTIDGPSWIDFFSHAIWTWSRASGIIEWRDARAILESIAWPFAHAEEDAARDIWNSARFTC